MDLLLCYLRSRRGGGYAALLRCWIRRARPLACAWRTESFYPNHPPLLRIYIHDTYMHTYMKSFRIILEWALRLRHRAPDPAGVNWTRGFWRPQFSTGFPRQTHVKPRPGREPQRHPKFKRTPRSPQEHPRGSKRHPKAPKTPPRPPKAPQDALF